LKEKTVKLSKTEIMLKQIKENFDKANK